MSFGVRSVTVFSSSSAELWQHMLHHRSSTPSWQSLVLPSCEEGGRERVRQVASGLSHWLVCCESGRGKS